MTIEILFTLNGRVQIKILSFENGKIRSSIEVINPNRSIEEYRLMEDYCEASFVSKESKKELIDRFSIYFSKGNDREETEKYIIEFMDELLDSFYMYIKLYGYELENSINNVLSVELTITEEYYEEHEEYIETYEGEMYPVVEQIPKQELWFNHIVARNVVKE